MIPHTSNLQAQSNQPHFHDLASMARKLGISKRSLTRWAQNGMPTYQAYPRGKVLVREDEVLTFLSRHQKQVGHLDALVNETLLELQQSRGKDRN